MARCILSLAEQGYGSFLATRAEHLGLGANVRLIIADEGGGMESPIQGRRLWDAMQTSLGKRKTQILIVGTLAPAPLTGPASWWPQFVAEGSKDGRHVAIAPSGPEKVGRLR